MRCTTITLPLYQDIRWDTPDVLGDDFLRVTTALAQGNMAGIREAFKDGYTVLMLGNKMTALEDVPEQEVLVRHNDKIIGVLVACEIEY